ncbi:hypothetical protein CCACVL1_15167 [Corchorus capsularis]|uniref:Uncharacterized protein n=1 Tax=Corchorus capsularis TaxID=210143 RepID=A0A1R3I3X8_COCAP|nr:hypothetical protein CCACVL1_15167 [Corchorus capsularis]
METEVLHRDGFGGSLQVDNVQSLASQNLKDIPSRYIRPEVEDLVKADESRYKTISHEEFVKLTISSKLDGKGLLDQMKL